ncbi:ABC-type sugar transport system, periplasmic component [Halobacteroides halobius DSM 5150]|uniref:ABC-type sugar transport system, periplasmic component n=1 Tax=Halobacteroides halobius (strain ATCC 35273 / DSM 5150 / MD-1) TaxID=748449 RepID=L0KBL1_HALHC|nr:sugar ABC transporter substrate-binding protein [Halobacteroides halobius]AGB42386.1 ABC-type sugar transport system, periplasmic component [Halobacteroides halobius DSM 5150]
MKKKLVVIFMVCTLVLGLTLSTSAWWIFGEDEKENKQDFKYKIAVVLKATNSDYWKSVAAGAKDAAKKYNVKVDVIGPESETQIMQQINLIQDQITRRVDALVVAPLRPSSARPILKKAVNQGIAVGTIDTDADFKGKAFFAGTGNFYAAKKAGKYMAKKLGSEAKLAIIRGAAGDYIFDQRTKGFLAGIKGTGIEVVSIQPADSSRGKAFRVMQNMLQSFQNINAVYAENDSMALGAARAIKSSPSADLDNIKIMGFDGIPGALKSIYNGDLTATTKQDSYGIGYTGVKKMVQYLKGQEVKKQIRVPTYVIDKENVVKNMQKLTRAFSKNHLKNLFGEEVFNKVFN